MLLHLICHQIICHCSQQLPNNKVSKTGITEMADSLCSNPGFEILRVDNEYIEVLKKHSKWVTIPEAIDRSHYTGDFFDIFFGRRKHYYMKLYSSVIIKANVVILEWTHSAKLILTNMVLH